MSANKFIAELERRRLVSDRLMTKLRDSLAGIQRPLSAEDLAKFLVQKGQLTEHQAREVLNGLTQSGVNLLEKDDDSEDSPEESSIFGANVTGRKKKPDPAPPRKDDDEFMLVPLDEEAAAGKAANDADDDENLPVLGVVPEPPPRPKRAATPPPLRAPAPIEVAATGNLADLEPNAATAQIAEPGPTARRTTSLSRGGKKSKKKKTKTVKKGKRWDSPLILVGGGLLTLLLLVGGTLWWLMHHDSGEQVLAQADEALKNNQYSAAIEQYESFLKDFPGHADHSVARVKLATVRIRQSVEAKDFTKALDTAVVELKAIEEEEAFNESQEELAALLPQIAQGLASAADTANPTSDDAQKFSDQANQALALCNNSAYIPKSLRVEGKFQNVQDTLEHAARRQQSQKALADGLVAMRSAVSGGKPIAAYAAHIKLLKEHPELAGEAPLAEQLQKTSAADQAAVHFVKEQKAADTTDRPTPWRAALAVANRRVKPTAPPPGASGVTCIRIGGAVYALDAASGRLLWRHFVGFGPTAPPVPVDQDVIVIDAAHNELQRIEGPSGKLVWRQSVGEAFAEPLVTGERVLVPTKSGRLYALDVKSGARTGYLQFPQPLPVTPTLDRQKTRIYVPGDEASVYSISLADMKCIGVRFLGNSAGSIRVPAVTVMDKVAVIENDGVETSRFRLLALENNGALGKQVADRRLNGLSAIPPIVTGSYTIVVTDRGQIDAYEINTGAGASSFNVVATRDATATQPTLSFIAVTGRNVWVADSRLTKFVIAPADNRLPVEEIENNFAGDAFDHPLSVVGETLIHVRRPKGRAGYVVAAADTKQGHTLWETDLAMPPASAPVVDEAAKALITASAEGYVFRFEATVPTRVQDEPLAADLMPAELPALNAAIDLGQGRTAFCGTGSNRVLLSSAAPGTRGQWLQLEGPLACRVTPLGQGFIAPLKMGQVFYLNSIDGARLATPFQPRLEPQAVLDYKPAVPVGNDARQFVLTDSRQKIYLVAFNDKPQPHLEEIKQADVGPNAIDSPLIVSGDTVLAVAGGTHFLRFHLPNLETVGETNLPAPLEWGPYRAGNMLLAATVDGKLVGLSAAGELKWQVPTPHGALAGPPLAMPDGAILAYRNGIIERRALADGKPLAKTNVEQPLSTGAVEFLHRLVVAAGDGTLLVVDKP